MLLEKICGIDFEKRKFMILRVLLISVFCLGVLGVSAQDIPLVEKGTASFYAEQFHLRKTASGEIFYMDSLTAAHKTLPLGSWVLVTNLKNNKKVLVKVNDRLPKNSKRVIDLAKGAARKLDMIQAGLAPVRIDYLSGQGLTEDQIRLMAPLLGIRYHVEPIKIQRESPFE